MAKKDKIKLIDKNQTDKIRLVDKNTLEKKNNLKLQEKQQAMVVFQQLVTRTNLYKYGVLLLQ